MIDSYKFKGWLSWPLIRAHLCTLAVAVSFNSTWRVPREAFRYGGVSYLLVLTVAMIIIALPGTLLQLAIGQLSQQDAVGVWRAVPFFKGVGYMRLLISYMGSIYSMIYVAMTTTYFLYAVGNTIPFWDCTQSIMMPEGFEDSYNESTCLNSTFLSPLGEQPEYYIALSLIIIVLWIIFPFILYNPVKLMKRILYVLGPLVFLLLLILSFCIGNTHNFATIQRKYEWRHFMESNIWNSAVTQALLSSQIAGGFLISSGDTIYFSTNVQWTTLTIIGTNVIVSWLGMLFWFAVAGSEDRDVSAVAVLAQMFKAAEDQELNVTWPLLVFAALFFSGIITMLTLLYPVYDRFRRAGGPGWRLIAFSSSLVGAAAALGVLAGRLPALSLLEDIAVPLLINIATVLEIVAFVFIYGWKPLVEDVEFLTGRELVKYWIMGWCAAPGIILPFTVWWLVMLFRNTTDWTEAPWEAVTVVAVASVAFIIFFSFATASVVKQVQYDFLGKMKSSFQPSRHWGPRDPITHYYWLARREEAGRGNLPSRYSRRQLGQMSGGASFLNVPQEINSENKNSFRFSADKKRSNSDDWLYTGHRKKYLAEVFHNYLSAGKIRSKSLECPVRNGVDTDVKSRIDNKLSLASSNYVTPPELAESIQDTDYEIIDIVKEQKINTQIKD